jgi:carboxyl-terminal processing protease
MNPNDHDDAGTSTVLPAALEPVADPPIALEPVEALPHRRRLPSAKGAIVGLALIVAFGAGIGVGNLDLAAAPAGAAGPEASFAPGNEFELIREAWDSIHKNYVDADGLDDRELAYGAIDGLTDAVGDTGHTTFMTPEERAARNGALSGSYVGIGAEVDTTTDGLPLIVGVFRDSPADEAGLTAGDVILAVDGEPTVGQDLDDVIGRVRGEAGTAVTLTIRSGDDGPERDVRIVRDDVHIEPVSWVMVPGETTAILRLEQFSSDAGKKLTAALEEIEAAGADSLVLDLRGNPGGYVNEAVAVASQFLDSGTVFIERNAAGDEKPSTVAPGGAALDIPLVVLVDGGSASAAEIVAGALQDAGRSRIVGEQTFGTGTVLGEFTLSDGSALRIGTVEWLTPKGRVIWHEGITPDEVVERPADVALVRPDDIREMNEAEIDALADPQLSRALELAAAGRSAAAADSPRTLRRAG